MRSRYRQSSERNAALPVVDVSALESEEGDVDEAAAQIGRACREAGFFYIVGHGVEEDLQHRLEDLSRRFFALSLDAKMRIRMELAGAAWRGYFPVGGELTSGKPDLKEGLYFGAEPSKDDPSVGRGGPLHGANLFPEELPLFRETVLKYMSAMTALGHRLMAGVSRSLGLEPNYFADRYTGDPFIMFRIFHYPPAAKEPSAENQWGVGEHTDYGLLTILKQDAIGGLQIKSMSGWIDAPPLPGSFVCNIGDMLDRMTRGLYRSTPHRVRNVGIKGRLSFPFFFDPNFDARIEPIDISGAAAPEDKDVRWDRRSVHVFEGTYGQYLLEKVSKVFPELSRRG